MSKCLFCTFVMLPRWLDAALLRAPTSGFISVALFTVSSWTLKVSSEHASALHTRIWHIYFVRFNLVGACCRSSGQTAIFMEWADLANLHSQIRGVSRICEQFQPKIRESFQTVCASMSVLGYGATRVYHHGFGPLGFELVGEYSI